MTTRHPGRGPAIHKHIYYSPQARKLALDALGTLPLAEAARLAGVSRRALKEWAHRAGVAILPSAEDIEHRQVREAERIRSEAHEAAKEEVRQFRAAEKERRKVEQAARKKADHLAKIVKPEIVAAIRRAHAEEVESLSVPGFVNHPSVRNLCSRFDVSEADVRDILARRGDYQEAGR